MLEHRASPNGSQGGTEGQSSGQGTLEVREGLQQGNGDLGLSSNKGTFLSKDFIPA